MSSSMIGRKNRFSVLSRTGKVIAVIFCSVVIASAFAVAHAQAPAAQAPDQSAAAPPMLPDAPGKSIVVAKCTQCHGAEMFAFSHKTADDWDQTITKMTSNGLVITDQEYDVIMDYLTKNLGPLPPKINVNKASAADLQKGLDLTDAEAQAIVKYHTDHGDFKDWHDVAKVDGVDPKKIEAKKDSISF